MKIHAVYKKLTMAFFLCCLLSCSEQSSEEKMLQILAETKLKLFSYRNSFCPEAKLAFCDSLLKTLTMSDETLIQKTTFQKAHALLEEGMTAEAIILLEKLAEDKKLPTVMAQIVDTDLGMAYLRLGEQTNCISNHSAEACIFPIKGGGIHKIQTGSRAAIEQYQAILGRNYDDLESRWLLNISYMTLGEYPQNVPANLLIPNMGVSKVTQDIKPFDDVATDLKIDIKNMAGGAILEDFDNDGYTDIVTSSISINEEMHYFKNNGNGTFSDLSEKSGLKKFTGGLNIMQTDYNNDGFKDIFVTRGAWHVGIYGEQPNSLLRNNGNGTFTDVTIDAGLLSFHPTQTATWNDFNNDGWLDLFIGNESPTDDQLSFGHPCEFYINNKNGTFSEISEKANCHINAFVKGVTSGDYNNDGWQDLFVSTMSGRKYLLKNTGLVRGKPHFEDVTGAANLDKEQNRTFPTWFWDFDNDGWLDIFVGDYTFANKSLAYYAATDYLNNPITYTGQPFLYRNNHDGTFTNVTEAMGLNKTAFTMGSNFGDIDNDGFLDMYLGTGNPDYKSLVPNKMFRNNKGKNFEDVTTLAKVGNLQKGHGVAFADMDNDGDQDIYIEMGGAFRGDAYQNSFFRNPGQNNNHWLSMELEGTESNKAAIGSRIKISFREDGIPRTIYRDVNSGGSFGSSPLKREIGLGKATMIDEIEIKWNGSGLKQVFKNLPADQFIRITEGSNAILKKNPKKFNFKNSALHDIPICAGIR